MNALRLRSVISSASSSSSRGTVRRRSLSITPHHFTGHPPALAPAATSVSTHATHRTLYRWTFQAIGVPVAVGWVCDWLVNRDRSDSGSGSKKTTTTAPPPTASTRRYKAWDRNWGFMPDLDVDFKPVRPVMGGGVGNLGGRGATHC